MLSEREELEMIQLLEQEQAAQARDSLAVYSGMMLGFDQAAHHLLLIEALEEIERGELDLLLVNMPPGSAKSLYGSVCFPAWYMGRNPAKAIIGAANTAELADGFGRKARNLVGSPDHQRAFPDSLLAGDNAAASRWATTKGGEYFGTGVGGTITGRRADCLTGKSVVLTSGGFKRIEQIDVSSSPCYVLSYEKSKHRTVYRRVAAVVRRNASEYFRIHTAAGHVVEATGNHRIYVGGIWKEAAAIVAGDVLLRALPEAAPGAGLRNGKEGAQGRHEVLLQPIVRNSREQCCARHGSAARVQGMQEADAAEGQEPYVLGRLPECYCQGARLSDEDGAASELRSLREDLPTNEQCDPFEVLFDALQERCSFALAIGGEQSELATRHRPEPLSGWQRGEVQGCEEGGVGAGRECLRGLQGDDGLAGASHRHGQHAQCDGQFGDAMWAVPLGAAWGGSGEAAEDVVSMVERVCEDTFVYDIEVEGTHNFFADGVLVHNCAIIDDPVKSREEADSELIREKQWKWWKDDLQTRLKPNAGVVVIMTRWHEDDLGGRILKDLKERNSSARVRVLKVAMEALAGDPLGRPLGAPLWPEWFTPLMLESAKSEPRTWSALYQQEPRPEGGGEFKEEWLCYYQRQPSATNRVILVDPSSGKKNKRKKAGNDYTSMWVVGVGPDGNDYVIDGIRDRLNLAQRTEALFTLVRRHRPAAVGYEEYGLQADIEHIKIEMERQQYRFRIVTLGGSVNKEDRIRGMIPSFQKGMTWMPRSMIRQMADGVQRDVMEAFRDEYLAFPVGAHDDAMDCLARKEEPEMRKYLLAPQQQERTPAVQSWEPLDDEMNM